MFTPLFFRTVAPLIVAGLYFHVVYGYRNHFDWTKRHADFLRRVGARNSDGIILFWAFLCDFLAIAAFLLADRLG